MKFKQTVCSIFLLAVLICLSCNKSWLEVKPDKALVVPVSIADYQALLDNTTQVFNINQSCGLGEIAAGDFYLSTNSFQTLFNVQEKSAYLWEATDKFYNGEQSLDWQYAYKRILNANIILDGIAKIAPSGPQGEAWNNVKGSALFFRAFDYFSLAQEYCAAFNEATSAESPGLPLRLDYDVNIRVPRSSVRAVYDQIIADLEMASGLLGTAPLYRTRPSRQAAYAMLARTYLAMEKYAEATTFADRALGIQNELMDYSKYNSASAFPVPRFNKEVIFHSIFSYGIFAANRLIVDPALYASYDKADCRKELFFTPNSTGMTFKGSYNGDKNLFGGLATDELYLIRAEGNARAGRLTAALADLNFLLKSRWKGPYTELLYYDQASVLTLVLRERRKELLYRGIRWSDLRRLNRDSRYAITLGRIIGANAYYLAPGDKRYVFPIDDDELAKSGIQQNDR